MNMIPGHEQIGLLIGGEIEIGPVMYSGEQGTAVIYASDDASGIKGYGIAAQLYKIAGIFAYGKGFLINIDYHFITCLERPLLAGTCACLDRALSRACGAWRRDGICIYGSGRGQSRVITGIDALPQGGGLALT